MLDFAKCLWLSQCNIIVSFTNKYFSMYLWNKTFRHRNKIYIGQIHPGKIASLTPLLSNLGNSLSLSHRAKDKCQMPAVDKPSDIID